MVRFINIGSQITEGNADFCWYDTITDTFISFAGQVVFDSWADFVESYQLEKQPHSPLERFVGLFRPTLAQRVLTRNSKAEMVAAGCDISQRPAH